MGSASLPAVGRRPFRDPALPWDQRVDALLQRLTLTLTRKPKDSYHWYRGLITAHRARTEEATP